MESLEFCKSCCWRWCSRCGASWKRVLSLVSGSRQKRLEAVGLSEEVGKRPEEWNERQRCEFWGECTDSAQCLHRESITTHSYVMFQKALYSAPFSVLLGHRDMTVYLVSYKLLLCRAKWIYYRGVRKLFLLRLIENCRCRRRCNGTQKNHFSSALSVRSLVHHLLILAQS